MNPCYFELSDDGVKFSRRWVMTTLQFHMKASNNILSSNEISKIIEEIDSFEKKLSDRYRVFLNYETDIDSNLVGKVFYIMQHQVNFYILACVENKQQAFKHSKV